jgi:tRNA(Ile)-lysidine synthase
MLSSSWFNDSCKEVSREQKNIWVAYSGGVDSHVLLVLAKAYWPNVKAVHINHGLSPNANIWQQHCIQVCTDLNIPLECIQVDAKPKSKQSPEDAARIARHTAWKNLLSSEDLLLLAHHADDQAETLLYRLFRGTGPKGLSGMSTRAKISHVSVFRPFLKIAKQEILNFAYNHNLKNINDESNQDTKYDRNFIRNQIMPLLKDRWPAVTENINRAGCLTAQMLKCLDPIVLEKLADVYDADKNELDLKKLLNYSDNWQTEILRAWLQANNINPSYQQILLLKQQVIAASIDANPMYVIAGKTVRRSASKLYALENQALSNVQSPDFEATWDLQNNLSLPNGKTLTIEQISAKQEFISKLREHQVIVKLGAHGAKAKKIFQQHAIPAWERSKYPLIFANGRLVSIAGLWASSRF